MATRVRKSDPNPFQVEAIRTLRASKWKIEAIAAAFEVSPRTINDRLEVASGKAKSSRRVEADDTDE